MLRFFRSCRICRALIAWARDELDHDQARGDRGRDGGGVADCLPVVAALTGQRVGIPRSDAWKDAGVSELEAVVRANAMRRGQYSGGAQRTGEG